MAAKNSVSAWSKDPILRQLQKLWVQSDKPLSAIIQDTGLSQGIVYKILKNGTEEAQLSTIRALATSLGVALYLGEIRIVPLELGPDDQVPEQQKY